MTPSEYMAINENDNDEEKEEEGGRIKRKSTHFL